MAKCSEKSGPIVRNQNLHAVYLLRILQAYRHPISPVVLVLHVLTQINPALVKRVVELT